MTIRIQSFIFVSVILLLGVLIGCEFQEDNLPFPSNDPYAATLAERSEAISQLAELEEDLLFELNDLKGEVLQDLTFSVAGRSLKYLRDSVNMSAVVVDSFATLPDSSAYSVFRVTAARLDTVQGRLRLYRGHIRNIKDTLLLGSHVLRYKRQTYLVYVVDPNQEWVDIHHKDSDGELHRSISSVRDQIMMDGRMVKMITNAGMYTPERQPVGLLVEDGKERRELNTRSSEKLLNFYMKPNGVFYIDNDGTPGVCATEEYARRVEEDTLRPRIATQSGPMLLIDGRIHYRFNRRALSRKKRSGVGVFNNMIVFAITRDKVNFYDFASFFRNIFSCKNALFLDGEISRMYVSGEWEDTGGDFGPIISVTSNKEAQTAD